AFLEEAIGAAPVVLFVLEWCEFCWSVRKLFAAIGVDCHAIALDSAALQADDLGLRVRRALGGRVGTRTVPQLFVGGRLVGGARETRGPYRAGVLQARLAEAGIQPPAAPGLNALSFLPGWLHPRDAERAPAHAEAAE